MGREDVVSDRRVRGDNPKTPEGATGRRSKPVFVVFGVNRNIGHLKPLDLPCPHHA